MTRTQSEIFKNATEIAEMKIRHGRALQSRETRDMVINALRSLLARFQRSIEQAQRNANA